MSHGEGQSPEIVIATRSELVTLPRLQLTHDRKGRI